MRHEQSHEIPHSGLPKHPPQSAAIDADQSSLLIHVAKSGLFSFAGDSHEVRDPIASGSVHESAGGVELKVKVKDELKIDFDIVAH